MVFVYIIGFFLLVWAFSSCKDEIYQKRIKELEEMLKMHIDAGLREIYSIDIVDAIFWQKEKKELERELKEYKMAANAEADEVDRRGKRIVELKRRLNKVVPLCHKCGEPWDGEHCDHE